MSKNADPSQADSAHSPAPDERDETIARLERALAQERQNAAALRATVDELRFKVDILEKSYAKQLTDARQARDVAEGELAAERARVAASGAGGGDTSKLVEELRTELSRVSAERDDLRARLGGGEQQGPWRADRRAQEPPVHERTLTIDDMLATSSWRIEQRSGDEGHSSAQVEEQAADAPTEMIAPELVFTKSRKEDDEP